MNKINFLRNELICVLLFPEVQNDHVNVDATQFRPNLVISGSKPYSEDNWRSLQIGNALFTVSFLSILIFLLTIFLIYSVQDSKQWSPGCWKNTSFHQCIISSYFSTFSLIKYVTLCMLIWLYGLMNNQSCIISCLLDSDGILLYRSVLG